MAQKKETVFQLEVPPTAKILHRDKVPDDYHCECEHCTNFMGEMFDTTVNKAYSNVARKRYLPKPPKSSALMHNNPGQFVGYRWAIQNLTEEGDLVFDPTVGTGTAIFEAENNGRRGIGVELEFPDTTRFYCEGRGTVIEGNTLDVNPEDFLEKESIQLLVNGTPYPVIGGSSSSDAYMTSNKDATYYGDYKDPNNIGKWKVPEFRNRIHEMYTKYVPYMKVGGYMAIIIKDPTNNKKPFNLHKMIVDNVLENNPNLQHHGFFVHLHTPPTMFMRTYEKRYGIKPPAYQTGIVLKKTS
jgi:hypothetical protein